MIVFGNAFQRLDMNLHFLRSTRRPLACGRPGGGVGEAFIKRSCTRSGRMGLTWGQRDASPNKDFGWNEQACFLVRLNCRGGTGKDPNNISHGRASGRLHYRALDTKISSNEKPGQFTSLHRLHHLPGSESIPTTRPWVIMKCIPSILGSTLFLLFLFFVTSYFPPRFPPRSVPHKSLHHRTNMTIV